MALLRKLRKTTVLLAAMLIICTAGAPAVSAQEFDLLLKGGHVVDAKNGVNAVRDVAIKDGKIAAVAAGIEPSRALKTVDVSGFYVTPGLIDIHAHVYRPTVGQGFRADNNAVYPDGFSFRAGVTTFVDPGGSGWRNFEDMKDKVIDRSRTRVLAFINIVGRGSAGGKYEQDLARGRSRSARSRTFPSWWTSATTGRSGPSTICSTRCSVRATSSRTSTAARAANKMKRPWGRARR
jgi:dihydroorotase